MKSGQISSVGEEAVESTLADQLTTAVFFVLNHDILGHIGLFIILISISITLFLIFYYILEIIILFYLLYFIYLSYFHKKSA